MLVSRSSSPLVAEGKELHFGFVRGVESLLKAGRSGRTVSVGCESTMCTGSSADLMSLQLLYGSEFRVHLLTNLLQQFRHPMKWRSRGKDFRVRWVNLMMQCKAVLLANKEAPACGGSMWRIKYQINSAL